MSVVDDLCRSWLDVRWAFDPAAASGAGLVQYDGRLGRFDEDAVRHHLAAIRSLAGAVEEADVADQQEEIDRTALLDELRTTIFRLEKEEPHRRNPAFWVDHLFQGLHAVLSRVEDDPGSRAGAMVERLGEVPAFLDAARATLRQPARVLSDAALAMLGGGGELVAEAVRRYSAAAPDLAPQLQQAGVDALEALRAFGTALTGALEPSPDPHAFAIGEEQFNRRLHHQHALRENAPELWRYGLHLRDEVEAEVRAAARVVDPTRDWREVVERVREEHAPDAAGLLDLYRDAVAEARRFLEQRGLATLPATPLVVEEAPAFLRPLLPYAAYQGPPLALPGQPGRFYVSLPDPALAVEARARLLRNHAVPAIAPLVAHEAWPGHHLQRSVALSLPSEVRRHVWTPLTVEGWGLYAEQLMWEEGHVRAPESRLLQLVMLLWRAVRIDLDIGLHTRGMTPEEAVEELVRRLPIERRAAEAEVRRYCQAPTYQLCYAVGRRELLRLRDEVRARDGAAFSLRTFHDAVLAYGGLPPTLIRWGMGLD